MRSHPPASPSVPVNGIPPKTMRISSWSKIRGGIKEVSIGSIDSGSATSGAGVDQTAAGSKSSVSTQRAMQAVLPPWSIRALQVVALRPERSIFTAISTSGNAVFLSGRQVTQYQVGQSGPVTVRGLTNGWTLGSSTLQPVLRRSLVRGHSRGDPFSAEYGG